MIIIMIIVNKGEDFVLEFYTELSTSMKSTNKKYRKN